MYTFGQGIKEVLLFFAYIGQITIVSWLVTQRADLAQVREARHAEPATASWRFAPNQVGFIRLVGKAAQDARVAPASSEDQPRPRPPAIHNNVQWASKVMTSSSIRNTWKQDS